VMAFRAIVPEADDCYRALGLIHRRWPMVPGRFKDYISTPKRNGYKSLHTSVIHAENMRVEIQIRSQDMHAQAEYGLASHWAYKQDHQRPDGQVRWIRDLIEILENAESPEELLEHTRMAMYQDRIFAFTPQGELYQLPKGATPVAFAYAVHTDLGDQAVGAKINGRVAPLRTRIENGDQVQILKSKAQEPQPHWLNFVVTGKARAAIRRFVRNKERDESVALGRKLYDEVVARLPAQLGAEALALAMKRLKVDSEPALMSQIARGTVNDRQLMEALMPGSAGEDVPGEPRLGLRCFDEPIAVHAIDCPSLADGIDADWVDLAWGDRSDGGTARLSVILKNEPGALAVAAGVFGAHKANILNLRLENRDGGFHTFHVSLEVRDLQHLTRIIAALRATDMVSSAERI